MNVYSMAGSVHSLEWPSSYVASERNDRKAPEKYVTKYHRILFSLELTTVNLTLDYSFYNFVFDYTKKNMISQNSIQPGTHHSKLNVRL